MKTRQALWRAWRWLLLSLAGLGLVIILFMLIFRGTIETGFGEYIPPVPGAQRAKTLWDWMELLLVPLILALSAALFTWLTNKRAQELEAERTEAQMAIEQERAREDALQRYLDRMAELIKEGLCESNENDVSKSIARAR